MIYGWSPEIGDPSLLGWLTVIAYFLASALCLRAARGEPDSASAWRAIAVALAVLGVNKQLDLQSLITVVGRELARTEGWYDRRRQVQYLFVLVIGVLALGLSTAILVRLRGRSRQIQAASAGFALLAAFVCIRAASFHHVDRFLKSAMLGVRFNWILELAGIGIIALAALGASKRAPLVRDVADQHS